MNTFYKHWIDGVEILTEQQKKEYYLNQKVTYLSKSIIHIIYLNKGTKLPYFFDIDQWLKIQLEHIKRIEDEKCFWVKMIYILIKK